LRPLFHFARRVNRTHASLRCLLTRILPCCLVAPRSIPFSPNAQVVKICDFGLAQPDGAVRTGASKGTGAYMAPELVNRTEPTEPYTVETSQDVWSFGVVMYAVLFADLPWEKARPSDTDFNLFCSLGGVSARLHPFQHVSAPMRRFMNMLFSFNPAKRPSMVQCAEFLSSRVEWYSTSAVRRTSISFGMRENKEFRAGKQGESGGSDSGMEDGDSSASSASVSVSSLPSLLDDVDMDMSAMQLNAIVL
jgi:serine/threonine protein kinase